MQEMNENQLKPYLRKFDEIQGYVQDKNFKNAERVIRDFAKSKIPKNAPPFLQLYKATVAQGKGDFDEAIALCREIEDTKPNNIHFLSSYIQSFRSLGCEEECVPILKRMYAQLPKNTEVVTQLLILYWIVGMHKEAQEISMVLNRLQPSIRSQLIVAAACYFRALQENNNAFYQFAIRFIDLSKTLTIDTISMKFDSLLKIGKAEDALAYIREQAIVDAIAYDQIALRRMEMEALKALGRNTELADCAYRFLKEINSDSLDEWRIIVEYHENAEAVIKELSDSRNRGPQLARIELAQKQGKDAMPLLISYCERYFGKGYLFSDIRPYLKADNRAKFEVVKDSAVHLWATGDYIGDAGNSREAAIKAQFLITKYLNDGDRAHLAEAANDCARFSDAPDCRLMLIKLAGMLGATAYAAEMRATLKLEAIQFLSLGCLYLPEMSAVLDTESLDGVCKLTADFCTRSISGYQSYINAGIRGNHFLVIDQASKLRTSVVNHVAWYFARVYSIFSDFLAGKAVSESRLSMLVGAEEVAKMCTRTDDSAMPIYVSDERVHDVLYPELVKLTTAISAATRVINCINHKQDSEADLKDVPELGQWPLFVKFVRSGFTEVGDVTEPFVAAAMAIAANAAGKKAPALAEAVAKIETALLKNVETLPEAFASSVESQKKQIEKTIGMIKAKL